MLVLLLLVINGVKVDVVELSLVANDFAHSMMCSLMVDGGWPLLMSLLCNLEMLMRKSVWCVF